MQDLPKLERVNADELELLHVFRTLDPKRADLALDFVRTFAQGVQPKLPDNVVRLRS